MKTPQNNTPRFTDLGEIARQEFPPIEDAAALLEKLDAGRFDLNEANMHAKSIRDKITFADGYVTLSFRYDYHIELSRINTAGKLLSWVHHLCGKNWMNQCRIAAFISMVSAHQNIKIPNA